MLIVVLIIAEVKEFKQRKKLEEATEGKEKIVSADEQIMESKAEVSEDKSSEEPQEEPKKEDEN